MRKEIVEFVKNMRAETTLDEIQAVCRNTEELNYVFERCKGFGENVTSKELPLSLRIRARSAFKDTPTWEITTLLVQKKLQIGYSKACAIKDWLVKSKGEKR
ncbi:MAG: hypothetical protein IJ308_00365 [Clostridia bacterium]|nr:hypothetical protein [Clostridia bacterium]